MTQPCAKWIFAEGLLLTLACGMMASAGEPEGWTFTKIHAEPNATGLQIGFWPNYGLEPLVTRDLGRRPLYRVGFDSWRRIETTKGAYEWPNDFEAYRKIHLCGASVIACVNISFSQEILPTKPGTIPAFYPQRITDPITREAAKTFYYAYVQQLLQRVGSVTLALDYELMFNYRTSVPDHRQEYRDWYVEAGAVARRAAADLGMSGQLRLIPIVNSNPLAKADGSLGGGPAETHQPQPWLLDVVKASDGLGIDAYFLDLNNPGSAETFLRVVQFWTDNYAQGKPVYVTETGFSSIMTENPEIPRSALGKTRGTEEEQALYLGGALDGLVERNRPGGPLNNQVRALSFWMYKDWNNPKKEDPAKGRFGLLRMDGSKKPAWAAVKERLDRYENAEATRPWRIASRDDVTAALAGPGPSGAPPQAGPVLTFASGVDFDFLRCECSKAPQPGGGVLRVVTAKKGGLIVCVNEKDWIVAEDGEQDQREMDLTRVLRPDQANVIDLYFTGAVWPFDQTVKSISMN